MKIKAINSTDLKSIAIKIKNYLQIKNPDIYGPEDKDPCYITIYWHNTKYRLYIDVEKPLPLTISLSIYKKKGNHNIKNFPFVLTKKLNMNKLNDFKEILKNYED